MQYFKHYHNASTAISLQKLLHSGGPTAYGHYFLLLELLCEKFDGESRLIDLYVKEVATKLQVRLNRVETILELCSNSGLITFFKENLTYRIDCPILLDLQDKDFKHATKKRRESDAKIKIKNKNKDKEEDKDKEEKTPKISFEISPSKIIELFNQKLGGFKKIKHAPFMMPSNLLEDFKTIIGFKGFQTIEDWEKYFDEVQKLDFLTDGESWSASFSWLIKPDNAAKILDGSYQGKGKSKNVEKGTNPDAAKFQSSADKFYENLRANNPYLNEAQNG